MAQQTMYPAIANSPQTELSAAIDAAQVTVPVTDASKLPAAPNLATIGSDETAETILYTGKSGNTLTGVTRGYQGLAKAWSIGTKAARLFTAADWDAARTNLLDLAAADPTAVTLSPGLQSITASRRSRIRNIKISGRTLVNLLGRIGNCDDVTKFTTFQISLALDASNAMYGANAAKATLTGTSGSMYYNIVGAVSVGKYYIALANLKNSNASGLNVFAHVDSGSSQPGNIVSSTSYGLSYVKFTAASAPSSFVNIGVTVSGANGQYGYADGLRVYEISAADYTAIDSMTAAQVAAKWPYVDDAKHVNAVYIANAGKNIAPGTPDSRQANADLSAPYALTLTATANSQSATWNITSIPNSQYTLSGIITGDAWCYVYVDSVYTGALSKTVSLLNFSTGANAKEILLVFTNDASGAGTYTFKNWQLELGSTATTFEPKRGSYMYLPDCQLRSNVDGSVVDSLYTDGEGKPRVTRRFREVVLDGALAWSYGASYTGRKLVTTPIANSIVGATARAIDYAGRPLVSAYDGSVSNVVYINPAFAAVLAVSSADSGWGDAYTPSTAEIAAYFYGWKINNGTFGNAYNGTGTKTWTKWDATSNTSAVTTVPADYAASTFTPYRLIYQLAASVDEAINYEGDLVLHEGGNQIEVGTGVVVREAAKPALASQWYVFNDTTTSV
ncbi:hypothetical protein ACFSR7_15585, partial [Cohnella sp. GCM10020058]